MHRVHLAASLLGSLLLFVASSGEAAILTNGSFEDTSAVTSANSDFFGYYDVTALPGWTVDSGNVDLVNANGWEIADGMWSVDLDGGQPGTISQTFATTTGQVYDLTFSYANNPFPNGPYTPSAQVTVSGVGTLLSQMISHLSSSPLAMDYSIFGMSFTADSSSTTLSFASLDPGGSNGGIVLDDVEVTAATPEPTSLICFALGGASLGLAGFARRRRAASLAANAASN